MSECSGRGAYGVGRQTESGTRMNMRGKVHIVKIRERNLNVHCRGPVGGRSFRAAGNGGWKIDEGRSAITGRG